MEGEWEWNVCCSTTAPALKPYMEVLGVLTWLLLVTCLPAHLCLWCMTSSCYKMELTLSQTLGSAQYSLNYSLFLIYGCAHRNRPVSFINTLAYLNSSQLYKESSDVWCWHREEQEGTTRSGHFSQITMPFCAREACGADMHGVEIDTKKFSVWQCLGCNGMLQVYCSGSGHVMQKGTEHNGLE